MLVWLNENQAPLHFSFNLNMLQYWSSWMAAINRNCKNDYHGSAVRSKDLQWKPTIPIFGSIFNLNVLLAILNLNHYQESLRNGLTQHRPWIFLRSHFQVKFFTPWYYLLWSTQNTIIYWNIDEWVHVCEHIFFHLQKRRVVLLVFDMLAVGHLITYKALLYQGIICVTIVGVASISRNIISNGHGWKTVFASTSQKHMAKRQILFK